MDAKTTAPCWHLRHTDGPTKGNPYECSEYGTQHFTTKEAATEAIQLEAIQGVEATRLDTPCHTITCAGDGCDYVLDQDGEGVYHHASQAEAEMTAREHGWERTTQGLICPACVEERDTEA